MWESEATSQNQVWTLSKSIGGDHHGERDRKAGKQNGLMRKGGQRRKKRPKGVLKLILSVQKQVAKSTILAMRRP